MQRIVVELKTKKEEELGDQFKIKSLQNKSDMRTAILEMIKNYINKS